nr:rRNA processing protein UTP23 [Hymenolepis microstoma]
MRVKRSRQISKVLAVYERCFGLDAKNLEIFLDHTFVRQSLVNNVNLKESITNLVGRGFRLVTSSCVIAECEALGTLFSSTLSFLRDVIELKCHHEWNPSLGATWCIRKRMRVARKHGIFRRLNKDEKCFLFAMASNDPKLQAFARTVPGMPIFFVAQRCINTEPIPDATQHIISEITAKSFQMNESELSRLHQIEEKFGLQKAEVKKKKRKGHSGPNPLSCRKRASITTATSGSRESTTNPNEVPKRRRKRPHRALHKTLSVRLEMNRLYGTPICKMSSSEPKATAVNI